MKNSIQSNQMKPIITNVISIIVVLFLTGVIFYFYNDNQKLSEEASRLEARGDRAVRRADSIEYAHRKTLHDYEALIIHYRHSKAGQERAEAQAAKSQNALRAAQKAKPLPYSDVQIDSTLRAWYPE